jgi:hypothetical protein
VSAKQKQSPPRTRSRFFLIPLLGFFFLCAPSPTRADSLEDAVRALARKVSTVPQRERRIMLSWQNHSSLAEEHSQALKDAFTEEFGGTNIVEKQEPPSPTLQISIEETPAFYVLVAKVPTAEGEATRISRIGRGALPSAGNSAGQYHLSKELIWQQQEPILDAVETWDETAGPGALLILNRESLSLYRRRNDGWELQDSARIPKSEKTARTPRGEIRFSPGNEKQDSIILPGQVCDVTISEKIDLNCRAASLSWREGVFLSSPCSRSVWWLKAEQSDWSMPDRLLLRNPSLPKSAASVAELELPGPALSLSTGRRMQSDTAVVCNLSTGNYEVYRITLSCTN